MLTVRFENNSDCREIYKILGVSDEVSGTNFVMYDEKDPVALFRMHFESETEIVGVIDKIHFLDSVEEGDRIFFKHAIFFKLIEGAPVKLRVIGGDKDFEKYGFKEVNGNMEINTKDINLHYMCGKK